jgi:hypothetical protein
MSAARSASTDAPVDDLAAAIGEASFVRVLARADGDALAAAGLLARTCRQIGTPFQVRVSPRLAAPDVDDGLTVAVGGAGGDLCVGADSATASARAFEAARRLDADADPVLALAGAVAAELVPGEGDAAPLLEAARSASALSRRPGVAVPTADLADGLAHTTLALAPLSGDEDAARAALADLDLPAEPDENAHRAVASLLAVEAATAPASTPRAAESVERALRPYETPDGPFETLGGYADVLDAVARERPGTAVALALGHGARTPALAAWRDHARAVHTALGEATTGRYDGAFVARVDLDDAERAATAARLLRDFRSPEPVVLVVGSGVAAAASVDPRGLVDVLGEAASEFAEADDADATSESRGGPGSRATDPRSDANGPDPTSDGDEPASLDATGETVAYGGDRRGAARFRGEPTAFVAAFREALDR